MYVKCPACGGSGIVYVIIKDCGNRYKHRKRCPYCDGTRYVWQYEGVEE